MPRPSLKALRSQEILDAFALCVGRYGLEGATLDRVAAAAGVKRPILRHYLGNRDDMIAALIDHLGAAFDGQTDALIDSLPAAGRVDALLDTLFDPRAVTDADKVAVMQAMVAAADRYPKARRVLLGAIRRFLALVESTLAEAYPAAGTQRVSSAAFGIVGAYFTVDSLAPLRLPETWRRSARDSAEALVQSLER